MIEEVEGATEALQKEATEAPTKTLQKGASREVYMCSVCGATVAPIEYETERGIRYRCPKCTRFMRSLTPEEVREKEEGEGRGYEDPYAQMIERMADKLLKELIKTPNVTEPKARAIVDDFRADKILQENE